MTATMERPTHPAGSTSPTSAGPYQSQPGPTADVVWELLRNKILHPLWNFQIYVMWVVLVVFALLPLFSSKLRPFWRILCWIAPTILALEVDAGNRTRVYVIKAILWVLQLCLTQYMLKVTDGFRIKSGLQHIGIPSALALFLASCIVTVVGRRLRNTIWFKDDVIKVGNNLRLIDKTKYADLKARGVKTSLEQCELKSAWISTTNVEIGRRELTKAEVSQQIIWTSLMTQHVVSRIFKDVNNRVFVYCPVAYYRANLVITALALTGIVHVLHDLFEDGKEREIVTSIILWLTLPLITIPNMLRHKFGSHVVPWYLIEGLLPVETDEQMWERLGISAQDLYTALRNTVSAEKILKDQVGLTEAKGVGTVKVKEETEAKRLCIKSLLRVGRYYARVSDGFPYDWPTLDRSEVGESASKGGASYNCITETRITFSCESEVEFSAQAVLGAETQKQEDYTLAPGTRILRPLWM